jgi:hypothetical protein
VITSKLVAQAPEYRIQVSNWKSGAEVASDDFSFKSPDGATKADLAELRSLDELPDLAAEGGAP